jgi:hypothetical protein
MHARNRPQRRQLFFGALESFFFETADAVAAGNSQASSEVAETASGEAECLSKRADKRATMPVVKPSGSQGRVVSSCAEGRLAERLDA